MHCKSEPNGLDFQSLRLHDTAQGPDVRFAAVPLLVQNLGRQVVRRSAYRSSAVLQRLEFRSQTEVADLEFH